MTNDNINITFLLIITMKTIYVVSSPKRMADDEHKFGRHTGTQTKLQSRYYTYDPEIEILFFKEVYDYVMIEDRIKAKLDEYRLFNGNGHKTEWVQMNLQKMTNIIEKIIRNYNKPFDTISETDRYKEDDIRELLNMLADTRADNYDIWLCIGMILFNCSNSCLNKNINFFNLWLEWSQKSTSYEKGTCKDTWLQFKQIAKTEEHDKMEKDGYDELHSYANMDNPLKYKNFRMEKFLEKYSKIFPIKLLVDEIINEECVCVIKLRNEICPFIGEMHGNETPLWLEIDEAGIMLRCHVCKNKRCPANKPYPLPISELSSKFGIDCGQKDKMMIECEKMYGKMQQIAKHVIFNDDLLLNQLMHESISGTTISISNAFHHVNKNIVNCTKKGIWYVFDKHKWIIDMSEVRSIITINMISLYNRMICCYKSINDKDSIKMIEHIRVIITKLNNESGIASIISSAQHVFYKHNKKFESILDQNVYLFGCDNGVYDLEKDVFRQGQPDDYISRGCGYDFRVERNPDHEKQIMAMIEQILPNKNVRDYVLKLFASCLSGLTLQSADVRMTVDQKIYLFSGKGFNGKRMLIKIISMVLGSYFAKGPIAMLTQKRYAAEQATSQLNKMTHNRLVLFNKPRSDDTLNSDVINELTGDDVTTDFLPQFKTILLCDSLPKVDGNTHETWGRLRNINFPSPPLKTQFKLDKTLENNFGIWKTSFLHILIDYFRLYKKEGLVDIQEITKATKKFHNDSDYYKEFSNAFISTSDDDYVVWTKLADSFDNWYKENNGKIVPNRKLTKIYFVDNVFGGVKPGNTHVQKTPNAPKKAIIFGWRGYKCSLDEASDELD